MSFFRDKVSPNYRTIIRSAQPLQFFLREVMRNFFRKYPFDHAGVCLKDRPETSAVALQQDLKSKKPVQRHTYRYFPPGLRYRQVLQQHDKIIPEVQKSFAAAGLGKRAAAHMVHYGEGTTKYFITPALQTPAQVYLFHVGKKVT